MDEFPSKQATSVSSFVSCAATAYNRYRDPDNFSSLAVFRFFLLRGEDVT
jgi:hypothetical protein